MKPGARPGRHTRSPLGLVAIGAMLLSLVGCSRATATAGISPSAISVDPTATPTASISTPPSPSPSQTPGPLEHLSPAPSGPWTAFEWIPAPLENAPVASAGGVMDVYGWSRGYVAVDHPNLLWDPSDAITPWVSVDGLHWEQGASIHTSELPMPATSFGGLVEGPAGLLAYAIGGGGCGGFAGTVVEMWLSTDGLSWQRVDGAATESFTQVWAGSVGYIATSLVGVLNGEIWTSANGRTWHRANLGAVPSGTHFQGAAVSSNGFVAVGATPIAATCAHDSTDTEKPALWSSRDGIAWVRDDLPGASPAPSLAMSAWRIGEGALLATCQRSDGSGNVSSQSWTSTDGRTWTPVDPAWAVAGIDAVETVGNRSILFGGQGSSYVLDAQLRLIPVAERGAVQQPTYRDAGSGWRFALGPAGWVAISSTGNVWIGVPAYN